MKTIVLTLIVLTIISCNNEATNQNPEIEIQKILDSVEKSKTKNSNVATPISAMYKQQPLTMQGFVSENCSNKNDCSTTIVVKQKNNSNILYDLSIIINNKLAAGTYNLQRNFMGTFNDAVNKIEKGTGENKYTTPTTYKQKAGTITFTTVANNVVNGSFTFVMYNVNDTTIVESITGTIKDLPIKNQE